MNDKLVNKGVAVLGENGNKGGRPIVVIGTARGGTSMVAGALSKLGVYMGEQAKPPVYEDVRLSELFEASDELGVRKLAKGYSNNYRLWGWKRPSSITFLEKVDAWLDRPLYIFIFKDIFSIAHRNTISMRQDVIKGMSVALDQYQQCLLFIKNKHPDAMLVSYEKAMSNVEDFVYALEGFSGANADSESIKSAIDFIEPAPAEYLDASRITKAVGRIDVVNESSVHGWARYLYNKQPPSVNVYINDGYIGRVQANSSRPDLLERFDQACAFSFKMPSGKAIKKGDVVRVKVDDEVNDLNNSPLTFSG